jgi:hypothetical protein
MIRFKVKTLTTKLVPVIEINVKCAVSILSTHAESVPS